MFTHSVIRIYCYTYEVKYISSIVALFAVVVAIFLVLHIQQNNEVAVPKETTTEIILVQVNNNRSDIVSALQSNLEKTFSEVHVTPNWSPIHIPSDVFDSERKQYNASRIINHIDQVFTDRPSSQLILAVIVDDIYSGDLDFVFSSADREKNIGVISLYHLQQRIDMPPSNNAHEDILNIVNERVHKTALRIVGGIVGLRSEPTDGQECVMNFSNSLEELDDKGFEWCGNQKDTLKAIGLL